MKSQERFNGKKNCESHLWNYKELERFFSLNKDAKIIVCLFGKKRKSLKLACSFYDLYELGLITKKEYHNTRRILMGKSFLPDYE